MWELCTFVVLGVAAIVPNARADVQVKGFPGSGSAVGQLAFPGADQQRYSVNFNSYLATPTTQAAEAFAPLQWRSRSTNFDDSDTTQATVDRSSIPSVVNTQLLNLLTQQGDPSAKVAFPAVSVADQERANVRPPNPSLCVGNGFVIEITDLVFKAYDISGKFLAGPVSVVDFFGSKMGGRFTNAACVFDGADTQRFYITVLSYDLQGGVHLSRSQLAVAVSISANPADGFLGPFTVPTMGLDAGSGQLLPGLEGCKSPNPAALPDGCLGAQPAIGIDQYGLWAGLNLYQINSEAVGGNYTGPLLLAVSKRSLLEGKKSQPAYAAFSGWAADSSFSLVPAITQGGSKHSTGNGGTAFVMTSGASMTQAESPSAVLMAWSISNTSTLMRPGFPRTGLPELSGEVALKSYSFADPSAAGVVVTQPDGGIALEPQDSRLTQVSYYNGMLWTAASTAVLINRQGSPLEGAIWWAIETGFDNSAADPVFTARIASQGYVSVMGNHIINPVITPSGASGTVTGVLAAGLVGPDYHLSPVWTPVNMQLGAGALHAPILAKAALTGPSGDNSQGTLLHGGSAATTDANGLAWVASEWANKPVDFCQNSQLLPYQTICANWGTYITAVTPGSWP
uniref:Putative extracellular protein CSOL_076 n=1 Tax=Pseudococcomyxa simplex TaxID=464287 RepID=A0A7L9QE75_9CHLO|nr:putative extracellular protein CSOL_076 [Pseudococcomyxa simplex]